MIDRDDWEAVYRDLIRDERNRLGDLPPIDELVAYTEGALSEERSDRAREYLAAYPELALDLGSPFTEPQRDDPDFAGEAELEESWEALERKLRPMAVADDDRSWPERRRRLASSPMATLAASLLAVLLGAMYWETHHEVGLLEAELKEPRVNLEHRRLLPDGQRGNDGPPVVLSAEKEHFLLNLSLVSRARYPSYRLRILRSRDGQESEVWTKNDLQPLLDDTFELWIPRTFFQSGVYRLELSGISEVGAEVVLASYSARLAAPQGLEP